MYNFDEDQNIFDQKAYESRVKVEAELMIALEALKTSIVHLKQDIDTINESNLKVRSSHEAIQEIHIV